eukprot:12306053-Alexandrium_andersonii.AAC.1
MSCTPGSGGGTSPWGGLRRPPPAAGAPGLKLWLMGGHICHTPMSASRHMHMHLCRECACIGHARSHPCGAGLAGVKWEFMTQAACSGTEQSSTKT